MEQENNNLVVLEWNDVLKNGFRGKDGTLYRLEGGLSADRYIKLQEYLIEIARGGSGIMQVFELAKAAYEDLQHPRIMDAGEKIREIFDVQKTATAYPNPFMKACALYFNAVDDTREEREVVDEGAIVAKCTNWKHITIESFFELLKCIRSGSRANSSVNSDGNNTQTTAQ